MEAGRFGEGRKTFLRSKEGGRTLRRLPLVGGHFFRWHDQKVEIFPGGKRLKDASASRWSAVTPFRWHDQKVEIFPGGKRLKDVAPPVGLRSPFSVARPKLVLDSGALLMEAATVRECFRARFRSYRASGELARGGGRTRCPARTGAHAS